MRTESLHPGRRFGLALQLMLLMAFASGGAWTAPACRPGESLDILAVPTDGELTNLQVTDPAGPPVRTLCGHE